MKPYDFLAMVPIIEGAGGRITNWRVRAFVILQPCLSGVRAAAGFTFSNPQAQPPTCPRRPHGMLCGCGAELFRATEPARCNRMQGEAVRWTTTPSHTYALDVLDGEWMPYCFEQQSRCRFQEVVFPAGCLRSCGLFQLALVT